MSESEATQSPTALHRIMLLRPITLNHHIVRELSVGDWGGQVEGISLRPFSGVIVVKVKQKDGKRFLFHLSPGTWESAE